MRNYPGSASWLNSAHSKFSLEQFIKTQLRCQDLSCFLLPLSFIKRELLCNSISLPRAHSKNVLLRTLLLLLIGTRRQPEMGIASRSSSELSLAKCFVWDGLCVTSSLTHTEEQLLKVQEKWRQRIKGIEWMFNILGTIRILSRSFTLIWCSLIMETGILPQCPDLFNSIHWGVWCHC